MSARRKDRPGDPRSSTLLRLDSVTRQLLAQHAAEGDRLIVMEHRCGVGKVAQRPTVT